MEGITNEALKEYYIKLQTMQENCMNILQAINQSMTTDSSEITVDIVNNEGATSRLRIPSFIYLESKLEQLDTNFNYLHDMPESGEAWMVKSGDMFKLKMQRSSTAPLAPVISNNMPYAGSRTSVLLKDLVSPHTYLRLKIDNLPEDAEQMMLRRLIINSSVLYNSLQDMNITTYDEYHAALFNYIKGIDYDEYDVRVDLPIRKDTYDSAFAIIDLPTMNDNAALVTNPWYENSKLNYMVRLSGITYVDAEDTTVTHELKVGDKVCLGSELAIYSVRSIDPSTSTVVIQEEVGHITLQRYQDDPSMVLKIYNESYAAYDYVDVPLEENQYVVMFLSVMTNNTRSSLSQAYPVDLSKVYMKDEAGNIMYDSKNNPVTYIDFYKKYCKNIGDLILGITESSYPQLSNFSGNVLNDLQTSNTVRNLVTSSFDAEETLKVVPINKHIVDDTSNDEIMSLHSQKNDIQASLSTVQDNISQVYNTLTNTDFSQQTANTMQALQSKLINYYSERTTLQKQLNAVVDNISQKAKDTSITAAKTKYRIRGVTDVSLLEEYIKEFAGQNVSLVAMEVQYKYKSVTKDTDTLTVINSSTFTDWNKLQTIERDRELKFDQNLQTWELQFKEYSSTDNVIKWNQIDIPIRNGEDVILRVRYKYCIGQPYINIYTPWSQEETVVFPAEYTEAPEIQQILEANENDVVVAGFRKILIDDGYEEHINNKLVSSDAVFYHMPENIYSGFNTPENNLISLKDKLLQMSQDIEQYKSWVEGEVNAKYDVYLQYDNQMVQLTPNSINHINIYNTDHVTGTFIKKDINIVIKNSGDTRVNFYSIFPGNTSVSLIKSEIDSYLSSCVNYERVPLIINNELSLQNLGQWIYFRQTNPYTQEDIYYNTEKQRESDADAAVTSETPDIIWQTLVPSDYMMKDNAQCLHVYRDRVGMSSKTNMIINKFAEALTSVMGYVEDVRNQGSMMPDGKAYELIQRELDEKRDNISQELSLLDNYDTLLHTAYKTWEDDDFMYVNSIWSKKGLNDGKSNVYLMRYEDIQGTNQSTQRTVLLDGDTEITNFLTNYQPRGFATTSDFCGAFLYPNLLSRESIMTEGQSKDHIFIDKGEQLVLPVVFEYYLDGKVDEEQQINNTAITKALYFDLKSSIVKNPVHYMIEITGHYDMTASGDVYSNFSMVDLEDNVTEGN